MTLSFSFAGIPIRIHAVFFLMALMLGATGTQNPASIGIWVAVVLVSVLLHELGHAIAGKAFGLAPQIDLHGMGGTTSWPRGRELGAARRVIVSLAGPMVGIAIGGAL